MARERTTANDAVDVDVGARGGTWTRPQRIEIVSTPYPAPSSEWA
jgi:hypothetical protein